MNERIIKNEIYTHKMSATAVGILCYLLSQNNDSDVDVSALRSVFDCGRTRILSGLKELKKIGYVKSESMRNEEGRITGLRTQARDSLAQPFDF